MMSVFFNAVFLMNFGDSTLHNIKNKSKQLWHTMSSWRLTHDGGIIGMHEQGCVTDLKAFGFSLKPSHFIKRI